MKFSPFAIYFAGVGTVVTALAVGFGSAVFLTSTPGARETAVMAAASGDEAKLTKIEKFQAAKRDEAKNGAASASALLAVATAVPVNPKSPDGAAAPSTSVKEVAPQNVEAKDAQPRATNAPAQQAAVTPKDGVQGTAPFEGADNAVEIKPSKKPIADAAKPKRRVAQRKTREVIVQSRRDEDDDAVAGIRSDDGYRVIEESPREGTRIVRSYQARSSGFGGPFAEFDED